MSAPAAERGASAVGRGPRERGFTLIEVLAALVIVALGMLGVIEAVTQTARNGTYMRDKTLAHWIAMNVITERRLQASPPEPGESSDELEFAGQRWRWTLKVSPTPNQSMRRMDVFVRPADAPETTTLASVIGYYSEAIGPAGGGTLSWSTAQDQGGSQNPPQGDQPQNGGGSDKPRHKPPKDMDE